MATTNLSEGLRRIATAFPGSMSIHTQITAPVDPGPVADYVHALYGTSRGYAYCCVGTGPHLDKNRRYTHAGWQQHFVQWPHQGRDLVNLICLEAHCGDVYLAPALRVHRAGAAVFKGKPNLRQTPWAWTDCDQPWSPEQQRAWDELATKETMVVATGRGQHVYVRLNGWQSTSMTETVNRRLADQLGGEKWAASSLLRPVGTYNWKTWARDRRTPPQRVRRVP
jgi:hypothetical protein